MLKAYKIVVMQENVLTRLRSGRESLSPTLQRIAEYVLKHPDDVVYQTITEIGNKSRASEASVMRFCRDLDFVSFQHFKIALATELSAKRAMSPRKPSLSGKLVENNVAEAVTASHETASLIDQSLMNAVAKRLVKARCIDVYGLGASGIAARYAVYRFIRLGLTARVFGDPHFAMMGAVQLGKRDAAIGISNSGSTKDTIDTLQVAKASGAFTLAITNRIGSPLTEVPDAVLFASSTESSLTVDGFPSLIGQLLIVDILAAVMTKNDPKFEVAIRETGKAVLDKKR